MGLSKRPKSTPYLSAVPTSGQYTVGTRYLNSSPSGGGYLGWVCTQTGTLCSRLWANSSSISASTNITDGRYVYQSQNTGKTTKTNPFSASSYTIGTVVKDNLGLTNWSARATYAVGIYVFYSNSPNQWYEVTVSGKTGSSQPTTFPSTENSNLTDGTCTLVSRNMISWNVINTLGLFKGFNDIWTANVSIPPTISTPAPSNPTFDSSGIVKSGLVAYYNSKSGLDIPSLKWNNLASDTYHLTLGGSWETDPNRSGLMYFNGINNYATVTGFNFTQWTLEGWLRIDSPSSFPDIYSTLDHEIYTSNSNTISYDTDASSNTYTVTTLTNVSITYDSSTGNMNFYIDGVAGGTGYSASNMFYGGVEFHIGGGMDLMTYLYMYTGVIDSVKIYDRILTASEILANRNYGTQI
jgi:hypothetical protein